jgi:hypothetical protein
MTAQNDPLAGGDPLGIKPGSDGDGCARAGSAHADGEQQGPPEGLSFPVVARLELDLLLQELRNRADDVLGVRGRLRGLLRAHAAVTADLSLPLVLRRVADAACELLNARHAAIGVVGRDGQLEEFVRAGMPPSVVDLNDHAPRGFQGMAPMIHGPAPAGLVATSSHDASSFGFAASSSPPTRSFIHVPIRVGDSVFGNLYVTERSDGTGSALRTRSWRWRWRVRPAVPSPMRGSPSQSSAAVG